MVEFVQGTTECCWGQPSDPCQRGCLTSHACCVMWGPRTLNADDDDDDDTSNNLCNIADVVKSFSYVVSNEQIILSFEVHILLGKRDWMVEVGVQSITPGQ